MSYNQTANDIDAARELAARRMVSKSRALPVIDYVNIGLADLKLEKDGRHTRLSLDGEALTVTARTENSFFGLIGQGSSVTNLFSFEEVVTRYTERTPDRSLVTLTVDRTNNRALGLVNQGKPRIPVSALADILGDGEYWYEDGKVMSVHSPSNTDYLDADFMTAAGGKDPHKIQYFLDTPIDGFGSPAFHLGLMRLVCANGMIAVTPAFRSTVTLPAKHPEQAPHILAQSIRNVSVGEQAGRALLDRMSAAHLTPASIREVGSFISMASSCAGRSERDSSRVKVVLERLAERAADYLGIASLGGINSQPASRLASMWSVADLVNMSTEITTHLADVAGDPVHHRAWIGALVKDNFDLEGLELPAPAPLDFHFLDREEQLVLAELN